MHGQEHHLVAGRQRAVGDAMVFVTDDEGDTAAVVGLVIRYGGSGYLNGGRPVALSTQGIHAGGGVFDIFPGYTSFATTSHFLDQRVRRDGADLVRMELKLACMSLDGRPARLPGDIRERLENFGA